MKSFGENLKTIRTYKKISQKRLGKEIGVNQYVISRYEKGEFEPSLGKLIAICRFLKISADELLGIRESKILSRIKWGKENEKVFLDNYESAVDFADFTNLNEKTKR